MSDLLAGHAVLIVENAASIAVIIARDLEQAGAHVVVGRLLKEGLGLIKVYNWSAAVVNCKLPDGDCPPLCDALLSRRIPFVLYGDDGECAKRYAPGVGAPKPAHPEALRASIEQSLGRLGMNPLPGGN